MEPETKHPAYPHDAEDLKALLVAHHHYTGSAVAGSILKRWPEVLTEFVRVFPNDYMHALQKTDQGAEATRAFQSLMPAAEMTSQMLKKKPKNAPEQPKKKSTFKMPDLDIEDIGRKFSKVQKVDDEKALVGNNGFIKFRGAKSRRDQFKRGLVTSSKSTTTMTSRRLGRRRPDVWIVVRHSVTNPLRSDQVALLAILFQSGMTLLRRVIGMLPSRS
jgi:hypothetical protein